MTSLKVAVRVRPLSERESSLGSNVVVDVCGKNILVTDVKVPENNGCDHRVRVHRFTFDYGFWSVDPESKKCASQKTVYEEFGRVVLNTLLEGYNSCVIAYGPSGSGKTYTMMGTKEENGLTPRICEGLFKELTDQTDNHLPFQVDISFMEIYNEQVYDLLQKCDAGSNRKPKLRVREHPIFGPFVEGLSTHIVKNIDKVCDLLARGNNNRVKAATHVHDRSTRSHAIFTIRCSQACLDGNKPREVISKLHLVDLAGSEKAAPEFCQTRVKEGGNINKSLVTLGNVISVLVEMSLRSEKGETTHKNTYVPYRDSNLTWLLKDSLGGNSHTFMLAAISPSKECYIETVSTLRYAQRAKFVMNRPVVNEDPGTEMIRNLQTEVSRLRSLLTTADKLSKAYVIEPLPEIVQLRTIMEESAKRVDVLTKHWYEKWLQTYDAVMNKVLQESNNQLGKRDFGVSGCENTLSLNCATNSNSSESENFKTCISYDSSECLILEDGAVEFSKTRRKNYQVPQRSKEVSISSLDSTLRKGTLNNSGRPCEDNIERKTKSQNQKYRSFSDATLRGIADRVKTPLLRFLSLSDKNMQCVPCSYSWVTRETPGQEYHCDSYENDGGSDRIGNYSVEPLVPGTQIDEPKSTSPDPAIDDFQRSIKYNKLEVTTTNLNPVKVDFNDGITVQSSNVSMGSELQKNAIHGKRETILDSITEKKRDSFQEGGSLTSFHSSFNKRGEDSTLLHCLKTVKTGEKIQPPSELSDVRNPTEDCDCCKKQESSSEQKVTLPTFMNARGTNEANRKSTKPQRNLKMQEIKFSEQVSEESNNLVELLKTIGHESTESSSGFCTPRRKDSEIMSLLSFSSLDVPYFRSLDDLSSAEDIGIDVENSKSEKRILPTFAEKSKYFRSSVTNDIVENKVAVSSGSDENSSVLGNFCGNAFSEKDWCYATDFKDFELKKRNFPANCELVDPKRQYMDLFTDNSKDSKTNNLPHTLSSSKTSAYTTHSILADSKNIASDLSPEEQFAKTYSKLQNIQFKGTEKSSTQSISTEEINAENTFTRESDSLLLSKTSMKLTKANLQLLAEELNEKTRKQDGYINSYVAFAKSSIDHNNNEESITYSNDKTGQNMFKKSDDDLRHPIEDNGFVRASHMKGSSSCMEIKSSESNSDVTSSLKEKEIENSSDIDVEERMRRLQDEMMEIEKLLLSRNPELTTDTGSAEICPKNGSPMRSGDFLGHEVYNGSCLTDGERVGDYLKRSEYAVNREALKSPTADADVNIEIDGAAFDTDSSLAGDCSYSICHDSLAYIPEQKHDKIIEVNEQEAESDFNDTFTLDSLDNFDDEIMAWASKYLTKYESQRSSFSTSDKFVPWDSNCASLKEFEFASEASQLDSTTDEKEDRETVELSLEEKCLVTKSQSDYSSSSSSSSSDSITYVFVGKNENEPSQTAHTISNASQCSSMLSSVSLDSLEKSVLQPRPCFMSPRTLSIDSLIAEELLDQLRNGRLPAASKVPDISRQKKLVMFSNFRNSFRDSRSTHSGPVAEHVKKSGGNNAHSLESNRMQSNSNNINFKIAYEKPNIFSFQSAADHSPTINTRKKFDQVCNVIPMSEDSQLKEKIQNAVDDSSNHRRHAKVNFSKHFSNEEKTSTVDCTKLQPDGNATVLKIDSDSSENSLRYRMANNSENCNDLLEKVISPPYLFTKEFENYKDQNIILCDNKQFASVPNNGRFNKGTQTEPLENDNTVDKAFESTNIPANYLDLTVRLVELMTETIKCLKEDKKSQVLHCCVQHRKPNIETKKHLNVDCIASGCCSQSIPYSSSEKEGTHASQKIPVLKGKTVNSQRLTQTFPRSPRRRYLKRFVAADSPKNRPKSEYHNELSSKNVNASYQDANIDFNELPTLKFDDNKRTGNLFASGCMKESLLQRTISNASVDNMGSRNEIPPKFLDLNHVNIAGTNPKRIMEVENLNEPKSFFNVRQGSPKDHLKQLVEIRRRVVEETKNLESNHQNTEENSVNHCRGSVEPVEQFVFPRQRSVSSSSEGYLSSVSSRGICSQFSDLGTDSGGFEIASNKAVTLNTLTTRTKGGKPLLLDVQRTGSHPTTSSTSWQNTSADSGAFFMDSPLIEKADFLDLSFGNNDALSTKASKTAPEASGVEMKQTDTYVPVIISPRFSEVSRRVETNSSIVPLAKTTSALSTTHENVVETDKPPVRLIDQFYKKTVKTPIPTKATEFTTITTGEVLTSHSQNQKSTNSARKNLLDKLSDSNYKVTREDIERVIASIEADKKFLRRRRNPVLDRRFSPEITLCSTWESCDELFPWDSYKRLPDPELYINVTSGR